MSEPRVIQADYSNWRTVAGRKVLQLVFEVPIEQTADVMEKLGVPMPGENKWCAIALLDTGACASGNGGGKRESAPKPSSVSEAGENQPGNSPTPINAHTARAGISQRASVEKRPFSSLPLSQQAAIRCHDNDFKLFLNASNADDAAAKVRERCHVTSRSQIIEGDKAGDYWLSLEASYQAWLTDQLYAEAARVARHG